VEPEDQIDCSLGARRRALPGIGCLLLNLGLFTLTLMAPATGAPVPVVERA